MARDPAASSPPSGRSDRTPPYSEEAETGVLGSVLLDPEKVLDLCIESQLVPESFFIPSHRLVYETLLEMSKQGGAVDVLTLTDRLRSTGRLEASGGGSALERLIDATPTAAHAEYYIDIVRQKHILRSVISAAREAETACHATDIAADVILGQVEQSFMNITERQHGNMVPWDVAVRQQMEHIEQVMVSRKGLSGLSTGLVNLDRITLGLRPSEMIVLAARPSMGKTSLAMNIAENIALGRGPDHQARSVGVFSLEMAKEALVLRMLCTHAEVSAHKLTGGFVSKEEHNRLVNAASVLSKAPIYLDDQGGLDILELRARARRMKKKHNVEMIVIDYLQLLHSKEYARQGRQSEIADVSGNIKGMAKELKVPVLVLSQLNRSPEKEKDDGRPKLADLRDSGAIEQDADVVCFLRRPCRIMGAEGAEDRTLALVDVAKQRNGPTGEVELNFDEDFTRFRDRAHGVDDLDRFDGNEGGQAE